MQVLAVHGSLSAKQITHCALYEMLSAARLWVSSKNSGIVFEDTLISIETALCVHRVLQQCAEAAHGYSVRDHLKRFLKDHAG